MPATLLFNYSIVSQGLDSIGYRICPRYREIRYYTSQEDGILFFFLIIRSDRPVVKRMIISCEHIRARGHTCNHVCAFPMDAVAPTTDEDSTVITWYRRLTMGQEEFRVGISILHPVTTPPNSPKGVSRMNGRLSY